MRAKRVLTCDAETDPFLHGRIPQPFIWGLYDGETFNTFDSTEEFVRAVAGRNIILYAHNGGKFDFMFLLPFVGETRAQVINGRIVSMYLGNAELRCSFAAIPEALKSIKKKEIEYWKLEASCRADHRAEIVDYLQSDCVYLHELVTAYRENAGTRKTIASNALAFARKLDIDPGRTTGTFDKTFRPYFFGGRCQCLQPGTHSDLTLLDIHSAYPFAMTHNHATGDLVEFSVQDSFRGMTDSDIARSFIHLECHSRGAFPKRTEYALEFPHEFDAYHITGWEYLIAKKHGLLSNEKIVTVNFPTRTIEFTSYVEHWYEYKSAHPKATDPINYTIGKIMLNSLYGKLAENPAKYFDYRIYKAGTPVDRENGWMLETEFGEHEVHAREVLWRWKNELGERWETRRLFRNVATGASITGFTRSMLLDAMHTIGIENVIYCDTDGIVARNSADFSRLSIGENLGQWGIEGYGETGHFARKKTYAIRGTKPDGAPLEKLASKGAKLTFAEIERVAAGETVRWNNPAPSFKWGSASFVSRDIKRIEKVV